MVEKAEEYQDIYMVSKDLPGRYSLITKEERVTS